MHPGYILQNIVCLQVIVDIAMQISMNILVCLRQFDLFRDLTVSLFWRTRRDRNNRFEDTWNRYMHS